MLGWTSTWTAAQVRQKPQDVHTLLNVLPVTQWFVPDMDPLEIQTILLGYNHISDVVSFQCFGRVEVKRFSPIITGRE